MYIWSRFTSRLRSSCESTSVDCGIFHPVLELSSITANVTTMTDGTRRIIGLLVIITAACLAPTARSASCTTLVANCAPSGCDSGAGTSCLTCSDGYTLDGNTCRPTVLTVAAAAAPTSSDHGARLLLSLASAAVERLAAPPAGDLPQGGNQTFKNFTSVPSTDTTKAHPGPSAAMRSVQTTTTIFVLSTGALAASPFVALSAARTGALLQARYCTGRLSEAPLAEYDSPTGAAFTLDDGGDDEALQHYIGATIVNPLLLLGLALLNVGAAAVCFLVIGRPAGGTLQDALTWARFPSALVFPYLFLLQPTFTAAVTILSYGASTATMILSEMVLLLIALSLVSVVYVIFRQVGKRTVYLPADDPYKTLGHRKPVPVRLVEPLLAGGQWVDPITQRTSGYTRRFSALFSDYRGGCKWFLLVELTVSLALGLCAALVPVSSCEGINIGLFIVFLVYPLLLIAFRPFDALIDMMIGLLVTLCQLTATSLSLFGKSNETAKVVDSLLTTALITTIVHGVVKLSAVVFHVHHRALRRTARQRESEKLLQRSKNVLSQETLHAALLEAARADEEELTFQVASVQPETAAEQGRLDQSDDSDFHLDTAPVLVAPTMVQSSPPTEDLEPIAAVVQNPAPPPPPSQLPRSQANVFHVGFHGVHTVRNELHGRYDDPNEVNEADADLDEPPRRVQRRPGNERRNFAMPEVFATVRRITDEARDVLRCPSQSIGSAHRHDAPVAAPPFPPQPNFETVDSNFADVDLIPDDAYDLL
jgi:hypothetical protein